MQFRREISHVFVVKLFRVLSQSSSVEGWRDPTTLAGDAMVGAVDCSEYAFVNLTNCMAINLTRLLMCRKFT